MVQLHRLIQWGAYICSGVFLAFIAAITTGYKFWGLPPETWEGLDPYLYVCGFILFALQFFKFTRVVSWWALPVMGIALPNRDCRIHELLRVPSHL